MAEVESLRSAFPPPDSARLDTLPTDVLLLILAYLDTARSLANLRATCRGLHLFISANGWSEFVKTRFRSLNLPTVSSNEAWLELARDLTSQSRDWSRRAFFFHTLSPPVPRQRNGRRIRTGQSIPASILVDAHENRTGSLVEELVLWGAGEDILGRIRRKHGASVVSESWHCHRGTEAGFAAGRDDTTAISILKSGPSEDGQTLRAAVGRANGDLRLISVRGSDFGRTLLRFRPSSSSSILQGQIQSVDLVSDSRTLVAGTKESVLLYPIEDPETGRLEAAPAEAPSVDPAIALSLKDVPQSPSFEFIRSIKSVNRNTIAVALNRSFDPIRVLSVTPTGLEVTVTAKASGELPPTFSDYPRTVQAILPVDVRSVASGGQNVVLSSWDDGSVRLHDLRSPSLVDRVYQDNFEVTTPTYALASYGLERFVAGSAHNQILKVFDYRWPKGYYYTDALPCSAAGPFPKPIPPVVVPEPTHDNDRPLCNHLLGQFCRWHALSRHDYYRPNCNIYLPFGASRNAPVYSLAKSSDVSPTLYVGLSGLLVEATLKCGAPTTPVPATDPLYVQQRGKVAMLETGGGFAIDDIIKCQGMPQIRLQSFDNDRSSMLGPNLRHRLDEDFHDPRDWHNIRDLVPSGAR
ncbi:hypothetical protein F5Y17DRAFT_207974 [Xylariaceae sp. FL0594]|nr:hypothetical protein F5Y17DRAFT_207974 [Xylariaceae sp. FL0594]